MNEGFIKQRCPKCGGNVFLQKDMYGWFEQCLQCSKVWYLDSVTEGQEKDKAVTVESRKRVKV